MAPGWLRRFAGWPADGEGEPYAGALLAGAQQVCLAGAAAAIGQPGHDRQAASALQQRPDVSPAGIGGEVGGLPQTLGEFAGGVSGVGDLAQDGDALVPGHAHLAGAAGVLPGVGGEFVDDGFQVMDEFLITEVPPQAVPQQAACPPGGAGGRKAPSPYIEVTAQCVCPGPLAGFRAGSDAVHHRTAGTNTSWANMSRHPVSVIVRSRARPTTPVPRFATKGATR